MYKCIQQQFYYCGMALNTPSEVFNHLVLKLTKTRAVDEQTIDVTYAQKSCHVDINT